MWKELSGSVRLVVLTLVATSGVYVVGVHAVAQWWFPVAANGSLVEHDGRVLGARLVGQRFAAEHYVWPRPSAVDWAAHAAGGSNLSPASSALERLASERMELHAGTVERPVPAELVTASGSGLDPHLTLAGALHQAARIAVARGVDEAAVRAVMMAESGAAPGETAALVEVLALNLRLDRDLPLQR